MANRIPEDALLSAIAKHWVTILLVPVVVAVMVFFLARVIPVGYIAEVRLPVARVTSTPIARSMTLQQGVSVATFEESIVFTANGPAPVGLDGAVLAAAEEFANRANRVLAASTEQDLATVGLLMPFFQAQMHGDPSNPEIAQAVIALNNQIQAAEGNIAKAGTAVSVPTQTSVVAEHREALGLAIISWFATVFLATLLILHLKDRRKAAADA